MCQFPVQTRRGKLIVGMAERRRRRLWRLWKIALCRSDTVSSVMGERACASHRDATANLAPSWQALWPLVLPYSSSCVCM